LLFFLLIFYCYVPGTPEQKRIFLSFEFEVGWEILLSWICRRCEAILQADATLHFAIVIYSPDLALEELCLMWTKSQFLLCASEALCP
jgi:hypothetical protein